MRLFRFVFAALLALSVSLPAHADSAIKDFGIGAKDTAVYVGKGLLKAAFLPVYAIGGGLVGAGVGVWVWSREGGSGHDIKRALTPRLPAEE